jgi:hypothetical protein
MSVPGMNKDLELTPASAIEGSEAAPQSRHFCGTVYWCCYMIQCFDDDAVMHIEHFEDAPICPANYGWGSMQTRYIAYTIWETIWIPKAMAEARAKHKTKACYVNEKNCREKDPPARCGNYPEN